MLWYPAGQKTVILRTGSVVVRRSNSISVLQVNADPVQLCLIERPIEHYHLGHVAVEIVTTFTISADEHLALGQSNVAGCRHSALTGSVDLKVKHPAVEPGHPNLRQVRAGQVDVSSQRPIVPDSGLSTSKFVTPGTGTECPDKTEVRPHA